jgi:rubrerythrin
MDYMANLTTKELSALEDQLGTEKVLVAKYRSIAAQTTDAQIKSSLEQIAAKHQQHFDKLFSYLQYRGANNE